MAGELLKVRLTKDYRFLSAHKQRAHDMYIHIRHTYIHVTIAPPREGARARGTQFARRIGEGVCGYPIFGILARATACRNIPVVEKELFRWKNHGRPHVRSPKSALRKTLKGASAATRH